jgi:hypothetical protein
VGVEQGVPGALDRPSIGADVPANGDGAVGGDGQFKTGEPFGLAGVVAEVRQCTGAQQGRMRDPDGETGRLGSPVGEAGGEVVDPAGQGSASSTGTSPSRSHQPIRSG